MLYKNLLIFLLSVCLVPVAKTQNVVGFVYEVLESNEKAFLPGANIVWLGTGKGAVSDENGRFVITKKGAGTTKLVVSLMGYKTDTIDLRKELTKIDVQLKPSQINLGEVVIKENTNGAYVSKLNSRKVQVLTIGELQRAACCNLSESFETNASVDVSYSDAVTGAKQIQLLGLSGIYSQIQTENIPSLRGLATTYGLNYIPGPWMESIQISKGTASVINGYESITGQINVEYKKPANTDKFYLNIYGNHLGRMEANINGAYKINKRLSTLLMLHGSYYGNKINRIDSTTINSVDGNMNLILDSQGNRIEIKKKENFMDLPKLKTVNVFNRWDYMIPGKYVSRFGIKYLEEKRNGGTMDYDEKTFTLDTSKINNMTLPYGFGMDTKRTEVFWKNGFMFEDKPWKSLGIIVSGTNHEQTGYFGVNHYKAFEKSFYSNIIYQGIINNTNHKFSTGLSYVYNDFKEGYDQIQFIYRYQDPNLGHPVTMADVVTLSPLTSLAPVKYKWDRQESVPGAFFEYTYTYLDKVTFIAGIRGDYHNKFGFFATPRANIRWQPSESLTIRISAGLGYRTANVIAENLSVLASQRILPNDSIYSSLDMEKASNVGINIIKEFKLFGRKAEFDLDYFRTDFINQVVVDLDKDPTYMYVYNLDGKSFSNSFQIQFSMQPIERFSVLLAYRINDAMQTTDGKLRPRSMLPKYKGLVTLSYATKYEKWKFDLTGQLNGKSRIPDQTKMPGIVQRNYSESPAYVMVNAQIAKKFRHNFEAYLGCENLLDFVQNDPITEPFIPYHTHFDTNMVWGPVVGRVIYTGIRLSIN